MSGADDEAAATVSIALSELRRSVDVGFAQVEGSLKMLHQLVAQTDRRQDEQGKTIADHEQRLRIQEQASVTRTDVDELEERLRRREQHGVTREDLDSRTKRIIAFLSLIIAAVGTGGTLLALFIN